jgi:hypothetical protein
MKHKILVSSVPIGLYNIDALAMFGMLHAEDLGALKLSSGGEIEMDWSADQFKGLMNNIKINNIVGRKLKQLSRFGFV